MMIKEGSKLFYKLELLTFITTRATCIRIVTIIISIIV
jgi:hypothetical protein